MPPPPPPSWLTDQSTAAARQCDPSSSGSANVFVLANKTCDRFLHPRSFLFPRKTFDTISCTWIDSIQWIVSMVSNGVSLGSAGLMEQFGGTPRSNQIAGISGPGLLLSRLNKKKQRQLHSTILRKNWKKTRKNSCSSYCFSSAIRKERNSTYHSIVRNRRRLAHVPARSAPIANTKTSNKKL